MNGGRIERRRRAPVVEHGGRTAHNIHLLDDAYTFDAGDPKFRDQPVGHGTHLRRVMQIAADARPGEAGRGGRLKRLARRLPS